MTQMLLALGRAECVWSLRPLLPGNSQAVRVALYAKDLYFVFFSFLFLYRVQVFFFSPSLHSFSGMAASRNLFGLEKGNQYLVVARTTCAHEFYILTHLNFLVKSINISLVFNHKWERNALVVTQFFENHPDIFLERPSNALKMCQIPLCPRSQGCFTVGK